MGRRGLTSMSCKIVLPTVSWVAVMQLLRSKAPKSLPSSPPGLRLEMALKAFMGCSAAPHTHSLRYADDFLAQTKGRGGGGRRRKPASTLIGCTSRPHTDSFRVHHVVNQEALQLMLSCNDDHHNNADGEAFFESDERCSGIIRDGDRLLLDDVYADDCAGACSSMGACSSTVSAATSRSLIGRNSVDSEGVYSTATSASLAPSTPELHNVGPHITCNSTPTSSMISSSRASGLVYSDHDLRSEARDQEVEEEEQTMGAHDHAEEYDAHSAYRDGDGAQKSEMNHSQASSRSAEYGLMSRSAGDRMEDAGHDGNYEEDADDEEELLEDEEMVAEICYSEDPLADFTEAISGLVVRQQLNKAAQLQKLYRRLLRLNAPNLHHTITLAFLHAFQRLSSVELPHLDQMDVTRCVFKSHLLHTLV